MNKAFNEGIAMKEPSANGQIHSLTEPRATNIGCNCLTKKCISDDTSLQTAIHLRARLPLNICNIEYQDNRTY